jgi:hypothetical protein
VKNASRFSEATAKAAELGADEEIGLQAYIPHNSQAKHIIFF